MHNIIDLRSDTVTRPTAAMRHAMSDAVVGDDVYGDDPTVNMLQEFAAEMFGFEAALFVASGTQSNFIALLAHCERGDEYIVGQSAHTYLYEGGGAAVFGSIQPQPIEFSLDGTLDLAEVSRKIKPDDFHFARTRLLCLENTQNGRVLPMEYLPKAAELAHRHKLALHLDGARLLNAAVKLQVAPREITQHFDSVSVCLSKGLGAPVGSVLCGNKGFIARARRWRKVAGGGMRQAGFLAAAGLYSLRHHVQRLVEDHENAAYLAELLSNIENITVHETQTNMVFVDISQHDVAPLAEELKQQQILINPGTPLRLVTHLDISKHDVEKAGTAIQKYFSGKHKINKQL